MQVENVNMGSKNRQSGRRLLVTVTDPVTHEQMGAQLTTEEAFALIERMRDLLCRDDHRNVEKVFDTGVHIDELPATHPARRRGTS